MHMQPCVLTRSPQKQPVGLHSVVPLVRSWLLEWCGELGLVDPQTLAKEDRSYPHRLV